MKKLSKEERIIYVLINNEQDNMYKGNEVIAQDTKEKLEQYKQQLINNGYENIYTIEEREHDGWNSSIRFMGYDLEEYNGLLYPSRNIKFAKEQINKQLFNLRNIFEGLQELKKSVSGENQNHYNFVLKDIEKKFDNIKNQKLEINMI